MDLWVIIELVVGLVLVGVGVRQLGTLPWGRRSDVRGDGRVVRIAREYDHQENVPLLAPVISFVDGDGVAREFVAANRTTWQSHQVGDEVRVSYPAGRPGAARLHSARHNGLLVGVTAGLGVAFLLAGLLVIGHGLQRIG